MLSLYAQLAQADAIGDSVYTDASLKSVRAAINRFRYSSTDRRRFKCEPLEGGGRKITLVEYLPDL